MYCSGLQGEHKTEITPQQNTQCSDENTALVLKVLGYGLEFNIITLKPPAEAIDLIKFWDINLSGDEWGPFGPWHDETNLEYY